MSKKYKYIPPEKKESNNMLFLTIAILLVLIIIGVGALLFIFMQWIEKPAPPIDQNNITNITNITNVSAICDDQCMYDLAIKNNNFDHCNQINDSSISENCFMHFANTTLSACLKLTDTENMVACVELHAMEQNDTGICNNLNTTAAKICKEKVVPCSSKAGLEYSLCMALAKNDYGFCNSDEKCLLEYAKATGTTDACTKIPDAVKESSCKSIILDQDFCYLLPLTAQKDLCYQTYAMEEDDSLICTQITSDTAYSLECLSYFATKESNLNLCNSLSLNNRWSCYTNYSFTTKDLTGCSSIDKLATTSRFRCFFEFAKMHGDPSACDSIEDPGQVTSCYVGSILNNLNLDHTKCAAINLDEWKNRCYLESARLNNDASFCNFIETENERKNCKELVE
jgi:hypothetical protein